MSTELSVKPAKAVQFSLGKLILLNLLPGILIAAFYSLIVKTVSLAGYPRLVALGIASILILIPVELGIILYYSKKTTGEFSISKMIEYREKISWKEYMVYVPILFIWAGIAFAATKSIGALLFDKLFYWIPNWYLLNEDFASFSKGGLIAAFLTCLFLTGIVAPIVEELYFRGFLLPRMSWMGKFAPIVNTILFAAYHFWSPWMIITRILALFPMVHIVKQKRNIYIGIIMHCMLNILGDAIGILVLILQ